VTVKELYEKIGGNYQEIMGRLYSESIVKKIAKMLLADTNIEKLASSIDSGNVQEGFMAAHTLKGMCANLSLDSMTAQFSEITEALRAGDNDKAKELLPAAKEQFEALLKDISEIE